MHPEDLRRARQFLLSFAMVMNRIPLPVPPRPPEGWTGPYLEVKEMYDSYNRMPSYLQEIVAEGLFLAETAISSQSRSADFAMIAQYKIINDMSEKTGVPTEMLMPLTLQERVRAERGLMLVQNPEEQEEDHEADEMAEVRAEIEDLLWQRLSAARGVAVDDGDGASEDADEVASEVDGEVDGCADLDGVSRPGEASVAVERPQVPRRYPRWLAAALAAAALALVGTTWMLARSINVTDSDATRKSAALNKRLSQPLSVDVRDSSQSFEIGDVSVTVRQSLDSENKGQVELTVLNKGDEERTLNVNVSAGSQPAVTSPTTLQPGEAFRRAVPARYRKWEKRDFLQIGEEPEAEEVLPY